MEQYLQEWHEITLPSLGLFYKDKLPEGKLKITPWTVAQEEAIVRNSEGDNRDLTHELLRNNVAWPDGFAYEDLLMSDQFFVLLQLRVISFIDFMSLMHQCPKCGNVHSVDVKLPEIVVRTPDETDPPEPYSVFLPRRKVKVEVRHQRVADYLAAERYIKQVLNAPAELLRKFLYARQILTIEGNSPKIDEKIAFVASLSLLDLNALTVKVEKYSTGVRGRYPTECPSCKALDESWVPPIHEDFFRPKPTDIERACQLAEED